MHVPLEVGRHERQLGGDGSLRLKQLRLLVVSDDVGRRVGGSLGGCRVGRVEGFVDVGGGGDDVEQVGGRSELERERSVRPSDDARVGLLDGLSVRSLHPSPSHRVLDLVEERLGLSSFNLLWVQLGLPVVLALDDRLGRLHVRRLGVRSGLVHDLLGQSDRVPL